MFKKSYDFSLLISQNKRLVMVGQYEELPCPFCDKGKISCLYFPSAWSVKSTGRGALGKGRSVSKSSETWLIKTGCSACGKTADEVEKELRKKNVI